MCVCVCVCVCGWGLGGIDCTITKKEKFWTGHNRTGDNACHAVGQIDKSKGKSDAY